MKKFLAVSVALAAQVAAWDDEFWVDRLLSSNASNTSAPAAVNTTAAPANTTAAPANTTAAPATTAAANATAAPTTAASGNATTAAVTTAAVTTAASGNVTTAAVTTAADTTAAVTTAADTTAAQTQAQTDAPTAKPGAGGGPKTFPPLDAETAKSITDFCFPLIYRNAGIRGAPGTYSGTTVLAKKCGAEKDAPTSMSKCLDGETSTDVTCADQWTDLGEYILGGGGGGSIGLQWIIGKCCGGLPAEHKYRLPPATKGKGTVTVASFSDATCATAATDKGPFDGEHKVGACVSTSAMKDAKRNDPPSHIKLLGCHATYGTHIGSYTAAGCRFPIDTTDMGDKCSPALFTAKASAKGGGRRLLRILSENATASNATAASGSRSETWKCTGEAAAKQVITQESSTDYQLPADLSKAACEAIQRVHDATFKAAYVKTTAGTAGVTINLFSVFSGLLKCKAARRLSALNARKLSTGSGTADTTAEIVVPVAADAAAATNMQAAMNAAVTGGDLKPETVQAALVTAIAEEAKKDASLGLPQNLTITAKVEQASPPVDVAVESPIPPQSTTATTADASRLFAGTVASCLALASLLAM